MSTNLEPLGTDARAELHDTAEQSQLIVKLRRENSILRREIQRLMVFRQMAYRDCLTGLHNRRYFEERLREECARATRTDGYSFSVILLDIDDFKSVNDTLGHASGDDVLVSVARFLRESIREVDLPCRLGGDEFALLLPATDEPGARVVEGRLRAAMARGIEGPCPVSLSVGVAAHPPGPAEGDTILAQADTAMYLDKRQRKAGRRSQA
ncbi:MAG: diguanylate cyclase (GGDEF)-like protein [Myxococcota bacterium]|jgi:diguanylate cyclase (GGDEF)-like protein